MTFKSLTVIQGCAPHLVVSVLLVLFFNVSPAQKFSTITGLALDGKSASSAPVSIFPPGKGGNKTVANINDQLMTGTRMVIPINVIVKLQSPGGTQVIKAIAGKPIEYTVDFNNQGENHVIKGQGAQIENNVKKIIGYSYRNTNEKGTTAASKGTVFTFTDFSVGKNEKASITTSKGTIIVIDKVPCTINGQPIKNNRKGGVTTKSVSRPQTAGDGEFTSSIEPLDYPSLEAAIVYINDEINSGETDAEDIADDLMCLGDLYMDMDQPAKAIGAFNKAARYYEDEYGDDDLSTIEARLASADAYTAAGNETQGLAIVAKNIAILKEILEFDLGDLDFAKQYRDTKAIDFLCDEITEVYDFLGWAYDIKGDEATSDQYYKKSGNGCN